MLRDLIVGEMMAVKGEGARLTLDCCVRTLHAWRHAIVRVNPQNAPVPFGLVNGTLVDESSFLEMTETSEKHNQGTLKYDLECETHPYSPQPRQ